MPAELFADNASTTVSSGGTTAPAAGTSESWTVASSAGFPAASSSATPQTAFRVVDLAQPTEWMLVTNVSGTTWTVTRGIEGTTHTHAAGFTVQQVVTSGWLNGQDTRYGRVNVRTVYGAKGDVKTVTDGAMTSGSGTLTSATAGFTAADVGKTVMVSAATSTAYLLATHIVTVNSATSITVADPARAGATGVTLQLGVTGRSVTDGVTSNDSATITSATAAFTSADVGQAITVSGAGRLPLVTTISAFTDSTTVTLAASATRTCTGVQVKYGTDDTAALAAAFSVPGQSLYLPAGTFFAAPSVNGGGTPLNFASNVRLCGDGPSSVIQAIGGGATATATLLGVNMYNGGTADPAANTSGVSLENLHIRGTAVEEGFFENVPNLLVLCAASDITVRDCTFTNFRSDAIYIGSGTDGTSERHNERIDIRGCHFDGINWASRNAISIVDGTSITIHDCSFQNMTCAPMPGAIDVEPNTAGATFARINGIRVTDCYFESIGGTTGVVGWAIVPPDSGLPNPAQGLLVAGCVFYSRNTASPNTFWIQQNQTPTTSTRPANVLITNNLIYAAAGKYGANLIAEIEGMVGVEFSDNTVVGSFSSLLIGYTSLCIGVHLLRNTFRNCAIDGGKVIELIQGNDMRIDGNLFYHCGDTILRFQIGASTGTSDATWFTNNAIRQGASNTTTTVASRNASHTITTPNDLRYYGNIVPSGLGTGDFVDSSAAYTVTTGALTADASLVPSGGTIILTGSTTSAAGALTVSNGTKGQIITFEFVVPTTNFTYATASNMKFAGAAAAAHTTTAGRRDIYTFCYDGTNWNELSRAIAVG